jgi:hypothetical protein
VREGLRVSEIVDRYKIEVSDAGVFCRTHNLSTNSAKAIDSNPYRHSIRSIGLKPIATRVRPTEGHIGNNSSTCIVQNFRTAVERRRGGDDVVNDYHVRIR